MRHYLFRIKKRSHDFYAVLFNIMALFSQWENDTFFPFWANEVIVSSVFFFYFSSCYPPTIMTKGDDAQRIIRSFFFFSTPNHTIYSHVSFCMCHRYVPICFYVCVRASLAVCVYRIQWLQWHQYTFFHFTIGENECTIHVDYWQCKIKEKRTENSIENTVNLAQLTDNHFLSIKHFFLFIFITCAVLSTNISNTYISVGELLLILLLYRLDPFSNNHASFALHPLKIPEK